MSEQQVSESEFRRSLIPGVVMPLVVLATVALGASFLIQQVVQANGRLAHTRDVISEAYQLQGHMGGMQTGVRGYLLTGDEAFLQAFNSGHGDVRRHLRALAALVEGDESQRERLEQITLTYNQWSSQANDLIQARRTTGAVNPLSVVRDRGLMMSLQASLHGLINEEEGVLADRSAQADFATERVWAVGLGLVLCAAGLLAWLFYGHVRRAAQRYGRAIAAERQNAEMLRQSESRLAGIIDTAMDAIISIDADGRIVLFNQAAERMFGVAAVDAMGEGMDRYLRDFPPPRVTGRKKGALGRRTAVRESGESFTVEAAISHVVTHGHDLYTLVLRDVTDRKRYEDSIKQANQALEALVHASPLPVIALDREARVTLWNPAAERLFGWRQSEVVGRRMPHVPEEERPVAEGMFLRTLSGESITAVEIRRRTRDGRMVDIELASAPLHDAQGRIIGMIGLSSDITQRKLAEEELRRAKEAAETANAAKDQFLAVLSHELRTPLTPVLSMVTALESQADLPGDVREDLGMVRRNVELEARLIDDMLDLTRIARGKLQLHMQTVDVNAAVRSALDICGPEIEAKRLQVETGLPEHAVYVRADPARLQQVFWNLLKNAVKFTPEEGRIAVRLMARDGRMRVEVTDSGIGIDPEVLPRIFNAFEQGERTITRRFGGLGLGLAISRSLIEVHGGSLTAASDGAGRGATFAVELPTIAAPLAEGSHMPAQGGVAARRDLRLLLVEDHQDTARVMARLLRNLGYQVTTAHSVAGALAQVARGSFDLIISDIGLPDGTGLELMQQVRTHQSVPAIALSGFGMESDVRKSRQAGFVDHLTKPVNFLQLDATIQRVVAGEAAGAGGVVIGQ